MEYIDRSYRDNELGNDMIKILLQVGESDIEIRMERPESIEGLRVYAKADKNRMLHRAADNSQKGEPFKESQFEQKIHSLLHKELLRYRSVIAAHIRHNPEFLTSLLPLKAKEKVPLIIKKMYQASTRANVGPMACVAGVIAETLGEFINRHFGDIDFIVENGGDIFMYTKKVRYIQVFAGESVLSNKIRLRIRPEQTPLGICTSAGTVGPSISFGKADAALVMSKDTAFADALATRLGNEVKVPADIEKAINIGREMEGVVGLLIIMKDKIGLWGNVEIGE